MAGVRSWIGVLRSELSMKGDWFHIQPQPPFRTGGRLVILKIDTHAA